MFICDVASVGPVVHGLHVALHYGLAAFITTGGAIFLGAGVLAFRRARLAAADAPLVDAEPVEARSGAAVDAPVPV